MTGNKSNMHHKKHIFIHPYPIWRIPGGKEIPNNIMSYLHVNANPVGAPMLIQGFLIEHGFVRISTLPLAFTVRIPFQKIYMSTICNVKELLLLKVPCMVRWTPVIYTLTGALADLIRPIFKFSFLSKFSKLTDFFSQNFQIVKMFNIFINLIKVHSSDIIK